MKLASPDGHVTAEVICLDGTDQITVRNRGFYYATVYTVDELVTCLGELKDGVGLELADLQEVK